MIPIHKQTFGNSINGCWPFTGSTNNSRYGSLEMGNISGAHRVAYHCLVGTIPGKREVIHSCDNRRCCRPTHLSIGTRSDNMRDMGRKARGNTAKLSPETIAEIKATFKGGRVKGVKALSEKFGVARQTITRIVRLSRQEVSK